MKISSQVWGLVFVVLLSGCVQETQPLVSPTGSWQGTLTNSKLNQQVFTAEITGSIVEGVYSGVFTVDEKIFNVTGYYRASTNEGDSFIFGDVSGDVQPATSPPVQVGTTWSGVMTEVSFEGRWEFNGYSGNMTNGEFRLERLPEQVAGQR